MAKIKKPTHSKGGRVKSRRGKARQVVKAGLSQRWEVGGAVPAKKK